MPSATQAILCYARKCYHIPPQLEAPQHPQPGTATSRGPVRVCVYSNQEIRLKSLQCKGEGENYS